MKTVMLNLKHQIAEHPYFTAFMALLGTLLDFVVQSWSVNIILFLFLFLSVGINTLSGIKLAKKKGNYDLKVLKEKFLKKVQGYIIYLIALWIFIMCLFIMSLKDGKPVINTFYLNIPMTTSFLFLSGVEFLSTKDNLQEGYEIKTPASVTEKIKKFVDSGGKEPDSLIQNK